MTRHKDKQDRAHSGEPDEGLSPGPGSPLAGIEAEGERVERFLRSKLANPADAQDLAQEAYLRLLRAKESQLIQDPVAYLFRIARNLVGEFYTKLPPPAASLDNVDLADQGVTVEAQAESRQQIERLGEVLSHLSPKCRAALILHRRDGMTVSEIAEELQVSVGSVKKYLSQGLARCRIRLRRFHE
jgi:RNA polymerase sigma-70 factor (ECF subfamily)